MNVYYISLISVGLMLTITSALAVRQHNFVLFMFDLCMFLQKLAFNIAMFAINRQASQCST